MKYNIIPRIIGLLSIALILSTPQYSEAVDVGLNYPRTQQTGTTALGNCPWAIIATRFDVTLSKQFNLIKSDINNANLRQTGETIAVDNTITGVNNKATGAFNFFGTAYGTPPMDNTLFYDQYSARHNSYRGLLSVGNVPHWGSVKDDYNYTLSSNNNNVLSCTQQSCKAVNPGSANITVQWQGSGSYVLNRGRTVFPTQAGYDPSRGCDKFVGGVLPDWTSGNQNFTPNSVTYSVNVIENPNTKPQVANVRAEDIGYNNATIKWDYTDLEGDSQAISQVQISTDSNFSSIVYNASSQGVNTTRSVTGLITNTAYYVRVKATDNKNSINDSAWVVGTSFRTLAYSPLTVEYRATSGDKTAQKGEFLNTVTGDNIQLQWNITDQDGGEVEGLEGTCDIKAPNTADGGAAFTAIESNGSLSGSKSSNVPTSTTDQIYRIELNCQAKQGGTSVNEIITLNVKSQPSISCSINGNTTVDSENPTIQVSGVVSNSNPNYILEYKRSDTDTYTRVPGELASNSISNQTIDYRGLGLGRYNPWLKVSKVNDPSITAEVSCGTVTNLGTSTIQEGN